MHRIIARRSFYGRMSSMGGQYYVGHINLLIGNYHKCTDFGNRSAQKMATMMLCYQYHDRFSLILIQFASNVSH